MDRRSYTILRLGLAITFIWIGILVVGNPVGWSGFAPEWVEGIIPFSITNLTMMVGILDIALGCLMAINRWIRPVGYIAALHLAGVLLMGINDITVRDIGLLAASLALAMNAQK